jgi:hypothetical protein
MTVGGTVTCVRSVRVAGVLVLLVTGSPSVGRAQSAAPVQIRAGLWTAPTRAPFRWVGDVTNCGFLACEQSATIGVEAAPRSLVRMSVSGTAARQPFASAMSQNMSRRADLFVGGDRALVWGGVLATDALGFDRGSGVARQTGFEYGAALRFREVAVSMSLGSGAMPGQTLRTTVTQTVYNTLDSATNRWTSDTVRTYSADSSAARSRWSSAEVRLMWSRPHWSLTALLGRTATRANPAVWGGVEATAEVRQGAAVVLGGGVSSGSSVTSLAALPPRRVASLGLRLSTGLFGGAGGGAARVGSDAAAFRASALGGGRYRLALRLATASHVELASDCTGWKPIAMQRRGRDLWVVDLPITPGVHRVNIRIDGAAWSVPPSLTPAADDFAGEVGVLVVE